VPYADSRTLLYSTTQEKVKGIEADAVRANEEKASLLMKRCDSLLTDNAPWLFGSNRATALDAQLIILIGRLQDVGRTSLISDRLLRYADAAFSTPDLQSVMQGRRTMAPRN
jgi:hypothetical protein